LKISEIFIDSHYFLVELINYPTHAFGVTTPS